MKKLFLLIPVVNLLMTGCGTVLSLNPLYSAEDAIFDPALVGAWEEMEGHDIIVVRKSGDNGYEALYTTMADSATTMKFDVRLVQLREFRFLDIVKATSGWAIPGHHFAKVAIEGDALKFFLFDSDWLKEQILVERPGATRRAGDTLVLGDSTSALRQMVLQYAVNEQAYAGGGEFRRMK